MNNIEAELRYSIDALPNRSLFLSDLNDINIYVEDTGKEFEYEEIFERLYGETLKVFSIFPLGGKEEVKQLHSEKSLRDPDGKLNIFIVDGDFDNLWDNCKTLSPNLIYLTRYNIESYFISKEATTKYMRQYLRCTRAEVESNVCFDQWYNRQRIDAGKLFILFSIARHHYPDLHNVNKAVGNFMDNTGCLIEEKYSQYQEKLTNYIPDLAQKITEVTERVRRNFDGDEDVKIFSIICGKYLFESLCRHLSTIKRKNINRTAYKGVVIANFDIASLSFLKEQIDTLRAS